MMHIILKLTTEGK